MDITAITEGMAVRLAGPAGHELHGATGRVVRIFTPAELWDRRPVTMTGTPFAWPDGQVLITLNEHPRSRHARNLPWTPYVTVQPGDIGPQ